MDDIGKLDTAVQELLEELKSKTNKQKTAISDVETFTETFEDYSMAQRNAQKHIDLSHAIIDTVQSRSLF